jgi:poly(A) polymerase
VVDFLVKEDVGAYLVGGYLRDTLLGRPTRDVDVAVLAPAPQVARKLADALQGKYVLLDEANGIARVLLPEGDPDEGFQWHFDLSTIAGDISADLARRDFTMDAMAVDLAQAVSGGPLRLIDPFRGTDDLGGRLIRVVSDAVFEDDPARLVRAVRLAAEYGFAIEAGSEALLRRQSRLVRQVAAERLKEELCRILAVSDSARSLAYLDQLGLLTEIVPELAAAKGVEQPREHYWDVFQHSMETVAALEGLLGRRGSKDILDHLPQRLCAGSQPEEISHGLTRAAVTKLAALLHDIAKPQTKTMEPDGRARFFGHTKEGAVMAGEILRRLRFGTRGIRMVQKMIEAHLRLWQMGGEDGRPTRRAIYRYFRDTGDVSIDIMFLSLADFLATQGPVPDLEQWQQHCRLVDYILTQREEKAAIVSPPKLIDGHDVMRVLGLKPGSRIGQILDAVREAQGAGEIDNREAALSFVQSYLSQGQTDGKVI